jgi:hypothetical protein
MFCSAVKIGLWFFVVGFALFPTAGCSGNGGGGGGGADPGGSVPGQGSWSGDFGPQGGTAYFPEYGLTIEVPENAVSMGTIRFHASIVDPPAPFPGEALPASAVIDVRAEILSGAMMKPMIFTISYDESAIPDEDLMMGVLYDSERAEYIFPAMAEHDDMTDTITFASFVFKPMAAVRIDNGPGREKRESAHSHPFLPGVHNWSIPNYINSFTAGTCLGMSAYCVWHYNGFPAGNLFTAYSGQEAERVALRAHLSTNMESQKNLLWWQIQSFTQRQIREMIFAALKNGPLILTMWQPNSSHAAVVYGWSMSGGREVFHFYDVEDYPFVPRELVFNEVNGIFDPYAGYMIFGYTQPFSVGSDIGFGTIFDDAWLDYDNYPHLLYVYSHMHNDSVDAGPVEVKGFVIPSPLFTFEGVVVYLNGSEYPADMFFNPNQHFKTTLPIRLGLNELYILGGTADENGYYRGPTSTCSRFVLYGVEPEPERDGG